MISIVLFDDHPVVLNSLETHFGTIPSVEIKAKLSEGNTLLDFLKSNTVDFVICDVLTDEEMGLTIFETIAKKHKDVKVIAYTSVKSEFVLDELKNYGVIAIVNKKEDIKVLSDLILNNVNTIKKIGAVKSFSLSPKEKEIAYHLANGLSAKEIASITKNSVNTINNQKNLLLEKFDCANTTGLVIKLSQLGLIDII